MAVFYVNVQEKNIHKNYEVCLYFCTSLYFHYGHRFECLLAQFKSMILTVMRFIGLLLGDENLILFHAQK
jgi:hypothetical protein